MYARITTVQIPLDQIDAIRQRLQGLGSNSALAQEHGFKGTTALLDPQTGTALTIALWETEADLQASLTGHQARMARNEQQGLTTVGMTSYEVVGRLDPQP
jgi:heme-degrading monooxygenase HmoA